MSESSSDDLRPEDWLWRVGGLLLLCLLVFCLVRMGGSGAASSGRLCHSCLCFGRNFCGCWCENFFFRADHFCNPCGIRNSRQALNEKSRVGRAWKMANEKREQKSTAVKCNKTLLLEHTSARRPREQPSTSPRSSTSSVRDADTKGAIDAIASSVLTTEDTVPSAALWRGVPLRPIVLVPVPVTGSS